MSKARILIYDIETAPNLAYTWGKWEVNALDFVRQKYILCVAWHWYGEKKTHIVGLTDFPEAYEQDRHNDYHVVAKLHELFEEADIVVAHNGNSFDQKETQARFLYHGLPRTSPYFQIDTKLVARRQFRMNSNSLNDLAKYLGIGEKTHHEGFDMWRAIYEDKDPRAWRIMRKYNKQDVKLLTKIYEILLRGGWITNHPNVATITGRLRSCPRCGAEHQLQKRGIVTTKTVVYQQYQCLACQSYVRQRKSGTGPEFV